MVSPCTKNSEVIMIRTVCNISGWITIRHLKVSTIVSHSNLAFRLIWCWIAHTIFSKLWPGHPGIIQIHTISAMWYPFRPMSYSYIYIICSNIFLQNVSGTMSEKCYIFPWHQPGFYSLSRKTYYRQIPWSLEATELDVIMIVSLWKLTGIPSAVLPKCLPNYIAIGKV